ncbi:MAG TPA: ATP synthase F1 subunit delta [Limnochordia bacterium]
MRRNPKLARRYGRALCEVALVRDELDRVEQQLKALLGVLQQHPEVKRQLDHRQRTAAEKKAVLQAILGEALSEPPLGTVQRFLNLLIDKRREAYLEEIVAAFVECADQARGIVEAVATVAVPLSEAEQAALQARLREWSGCDVRLRVVIDESVIGGVKVRIKDRVIDDTVKHRLERLRAAIARAPWN